MTIVNRIDAALNNLSPTLLKRSGAVFYTGREGFVGHKPVYFVGLNPGGSPTDQVDNTIGRHLMVHHDRANPWSAYADESWESKVAGTHGMQPRVLHMMQRLSLCPRETPASNVVFVRTPRASALRDEKARLMDACWPVHQAVIETLGVKVVVCFGEDAAKWVRRRLGAVGQSDYFRENYPTRAWVSRSYRAPSGLIVVKVSHPSVAKWQEPTADPTILVERALAAIA